MMQSEYWRNLVLAFLSYNIVKRQKGDYMKKIGKFLFWLTGFLYTMNDFKMARKDKRFAEIREKLYDTFSDMGASDTLCRGIWRFVLIVTFLLVWPLWLIQVILDMTVNKD